MTFLKILFTRSSLYGRTGLPASVDQPILSCRSFSFTVN